MRQLLFLFIVCGLCASCSKKNDDDKTPPVVTLNSPTNNQNFAPGEIKIKAMVTDNAYIGQIHVEIYNGKNDAEITHVHIHPGTTTYALDFPLMLESGINYRIKVVAEDPAQNTSFQQVEISCN